MRPARRSVVTGRYYETALVSRDHVVLRLTTGPIPDVDVDGGTLVGNEVRIANRGVLVGAGENGLTGRPTDPIVMRDGELCFEPVNGGVRTRENRLARGVHNGVVAEATHFGMVNAYVHATRAARYVNGLLDQLGAPALPRLPVIVSAHSGSRLPGFAGGDGDYRSGRMRPLSGGHYRLSQRTTGVPEPEPVCASGEVHLGPGRLRHAFAGHDSYLRAAAHNPATIYHEYGHHLCRHTADFRLNAERRPDEQRNGKPGIEEGICDYLVASMLGTGRPYGWYHEERGARRDPGVTQVLQDDDVDDPYTVGARWSALWWGCRQRLATRGCLAPSGHDRAVVATLLALGDVATDSRSRRVRQHGRCDPNTVLDAYFAAVRAEGGSAAIDAIRDCGVLTRSSASRVALAGM